MRAFTIPLLFVAWTPLPAQTKPESIALRHVAVVDVRRGRSQSDMTVVIDDRRIVAVGRARSVRMPVGARIVDASGKFLIPGLWDMHVHALVESRLATFFPLFVANGITGVRNMGSPMPLSRIAELRTASEEGRILAPRIVANGPILDGPRSGVAAPLIVTSAADGRLAVDSLRAQKADFIKVYNNLSREAFFAIADEAKALSLPIAGHLPVAVSPIEASRAGQKSIEHMGNPSGGLLLGCSTAEVAIRQRWIDAVTDTAVTRESVVRRMASTIPEIIDSFDPSKAARLARDLAQHQTWQTPTFVVLRRFAALADTARADDASQRYLLRAERERGDPRAVPVFRDLSPEISRGFARLYPKQVELARLMRDARVPFLAGTDTPVMLGVPGFSLHEELESFVAAGFTPAEALRVATLNPARFLGRERDLGTIEKGKLADVVLLDADPLVDIRNTRRIAAVVLNGRYLSADTLGRMLQDVEAAAR